jgi:hypothetical protein
MTPGEKKFWAVQRRTDRRQSQPLPIRILRRQSAMPLDPSQARKKVRSFLPAGSLQTPASADDVEDDEGEEADEEHGGRRVRLLDFVGFNQQLLRHEVEEGGEPEGDGTRQPGT